MSPLVRLHAAAGAAALVLVATFQIATLAVEIAGDASAIARVKTAIAWGLLALVPAMAAAGATGARLAGSPPRGLPARKAKRMKVIAANGVAILVPSALFLAMKANAGAFDAVFVAVQALEIVAGLGNATLLALNLRDGLAMRRGRLSRERRGQT
ncbi:MAG: hypothetical protein JNK46_01295 [Methylobacteriaceae bacterium]|nr:hypothetical protein [Methylobacteriaceae bacterium]